MSDPVSNSEIEDVLASIRRLVSENAKALKGDRAREPEAEKLVLTPALRVDESDAPQAPADVFAVDTETWNDVSGASEGAENKDVFAPLDGPAPAAADPADEVDEAETAAVDEAHEGEKAAGAEGVEAAFAESRDAALNAGSENGAEAGDASGSSAETQAETQAETESVQDDSASANDLEQQIAELETEMDLRPAAETAPEPGTPEPGVADSGVTDSGAPETGQGDEITHPDGPETPADASAETPAAEVSNAPPKSWIEGLVAAAASAEAARLTARATAPEGVEETAAPEPVADPDEIAAAQVAETVSADGAEAGLDEAGADMADEGTTDTELAAKPFELTAEHAAPVEPEALAPEGEEPEVEEPEVEAPEAEDVDTTEGEDAALGAAGASDETEIADEADAIAADEAGAEDAEDIGDKAAEPAAGPERSWVDRLIVAAATLRNKPDAAEAGEATPGEATPGEGTPGEGTPDEASPDEATDEPAETSSAAGGAEDAPANAAALDEPADEVEADAVDAQAPADTTETEAQADTTEAEIEATPALAPLNLVDPIMTTSDPENVVPEWEPVDPPEQAARDAEEPVVDIDTVLTGPWSASAVGEALDESVDETLAEPADEDMATVAAVGAEAETLAEAEETIVDDAAGAQERPIGALEWEPVDPPEEAETEAHVATGALEMGADAEAALDTETSEADIGVTEDDIDDDVTFEADTASEGVDFQKETEGKIEGGEATGATEDGTLTAIGDSDEDEAEAIDEDSAAVAAAAEAEVDWGDAGMAAAGVAAMTATLRTAEDTEDASASADIEGADDADRSDSADEIVVDEGMLRELVAQLVRDELQGTVGERITHNVRRLIRREIARALTLQDFEK